jgi:hypothetical protein
MEVRSSTFKITVRSDGRFTDECVITLDTRFTQNFQNSPVIMQPDTFLAENFETDIVEVQDFIIRDIPDFQKAFQRELVFGIAHSLVGLYDYFHAISTYKNGYVTTNRETERLGWM